MNVYDDLLSLINEQGSLMVLRERLVLLKEQLDSQVSASEANAANLAEQVAQLEAKMADLETHNRRLQEENETLQLENRHLRQKISRSDGQVEQQRFFRRKIYLSILERAILLQLARYASRTVEELAEEIGIEQTTVIQNLKAMETSCFVRSESVPMMGTIWFLSRPGRRYLTENELID